MAERNKLAALSLPLLQGLCRAKGIKAEKGDSKAELLARLERPSRKRRLVEEEAPAPQLKADVPVSRPVQMVFQSAVEVQSFRLLRCAYCSAIFNLEKTRYTGDPKRFWCPSCRFRAMDPFNEVGTDGVLHCSLLEGEICELVLHLPKLQEWREAGEAIWVRMLRLDSEELAQVWPEELAMEAEGSQLFRIAPPEKEAFVKGARVIVSFPGAHGTAWNVLMQRAKLKNSLATTCVFLPDKDAPGFGVHVPDPQRDARGHEKGVPKDACHCYHLYGKEHWPAEWGCKWYDMWMRKTRTASEKGCELCVVTKGDGGLGNSQKGEVRFLEKELGQSFKTLSLVEFASWAACEAMKRGQDGVMIQK
ncbi:unnamed protein product [Effrenium voratum]|nr:unnamed protein product [Effrenium voratum]